MPGRKLSGGYRYGFNGKENDNEVKGEGNQQDYGLRIYDPRLGKFLSVDPLAKEYPWYTPYQFAGNTPIQAIDLDGGEPKVAGKNEAESGKDFVIAGTGPGGYGEIQRNWKWHSGGLTTSSGKKTQANWYSPDDYLTLLSKTNAAATTADKLNLFSSAAKGWQKSSADAGQRELENFVGDGSNDNAASSILMAAQIRANNANTSVSGRADLSSVNVEDFIGVGLLLKQLVKQGIKVGVGEAANMGASKLPTQIHHFATNKSKTFTPQMSQIADEFGLSLNGAWNKQALPHLGRHPNAYHNFVLDGMQKARAGAGGSQAEFLNLFNQYVKKPVIQNPGLLRKSGW
jgi:RHS repeat-associated protein